MKRQLVAAEPKHDALVDALVIDAHPRELDPVLRAPVHPWPLGNP